MPVLVSLRTHLWCPTSDRLTAPLSASMEAQDNLLDTPLVDASPVTESHNPSDSVGGSHSDPSGITSRKGLSYAHIQAPATGDPQLLGRTLTSVYHLSRQEQDPGRTRYRTILPKLGGRCPSEGTGKGKEAVQNVERELPANFIPRSSLETEHELDSGAEFSCGYESEALRKYKREGQRRQRDRLNHLYNELRPVVPNGSKLDKASLLGAAAAYVLELQRKIQAQEMRNEVEGSANPNVEKPACSALTLRSHGSSGTSRNFQVEHMLEDKPIVNIDIMGGEAMVRVSHLKDGRTVYPLLMSTLRDLQMEVRHANVSMVENRGYHVITATMNPANILSQDQLLGAINRSLGSLRLASEHASEEKRPSPSD